MTSPMDELIPSIVAKSNKTSADLQQIIDTWRDHLLSNEENLLRRAQQLNQTQQTLNSTTERFVRMQDLLGDIEQTVEQFNSSLESLTKYNDELENDVERLNNESKHLLPNVMSNTKTDQDRTVTYELMETVDNDIAKLAQTLDNLNRTLKIDTDTSLVKTTHDLQTCFHDIHEMQETMKRMML